VFGIACGFAASPAALRPGCGFAAGWRLRGVRPAAGPARRAPEEVPEPPLL